jgi:hypothetical protein
MLPEWTAEFPSLLGRWTGTPCARSVAVQRESDRATPASAKDSGAELPAERSGPVQRAVPNTNVGACLLKPA